MPDGSTKTWLTNEGPVLIKLGRVITLNKHAPNRLYASEGSIVELYCWNGEYGSLVGLRAQDPEWHESWNDLDGMVDEESGFWAEIPDVIVCSDLSAPSEMFVSANHVFKGVELKDKQCKILSSIDQTKLVFVEFGEDIGGCSADGLGRRGHCIAVPRKILKTVEKQAAKSKEK